MDFKDQIKLMGERVIKLKDQIQTEEATKTALIMPFLQSLGYDVFNPMEVVPEFISDIGTKKGEKVDYAIQKDNTPIILIECKHWLKNLDPHDGQLLRYFHVTKAKFAILTNGIKYKFYTDLVEPNKMDEKPFFEFDITDMRENQIEELKKFHKSYFDIQNIVNTASELKYTNEIKQILRNELNNPTESFIRYFATQVYSGKVTEKIMFKFSELVKKSVTQIVSDIITERLKSALAKEDIASQESATNDKSTETIGTQQEKPIVDAKGSKIDTTEAELEAYYLVKSILRQKVDPARIFHRDGQTYFSIILDDNNRKTICRIYMNSAKKQIGIFNESKNEIKHEITELNDIYNFSSQLIATVDTYDKINK